MFMSLLVGYYAPRKETDLNWRVTLYNIMTRHQMMSRAWQI